MDYKLKVGETEFDVAVDKGENGYTLTVGGESKHLTIDTSVPHVYHLRVDGALKTIAAVPGKDGVWVWIDGRVRLVQDAEQARRRSGSGGADGPKEVTPMTPATVVSVLVSVGDHIEKGQGAVVVSAMKMEMTLAAPYSGTVTAVNTEAGAKANPGDKLVEIEKDEEGEDGDG